MMQALLVVLLTAYCHVFSSSGGPVHASQLSYLPYLELSSGAGSLPALDDGISPTLTLPSNLPFKQSNQTTAFISTNGLVSFGSSSDDFPVDRNEFPNLDRFLVAPYWADFDLRKKGRVAYEIFASPDSSVVQAVNEFLADNQTLVFSGSWALLASWEDTCRFGDRQCEVTKPNTFQVAITTDGVYSYAIATYQCGDINWNGYSDNSPGNTVVGYLAGQGVHGSHNLSSTPSVIDIACLNLPSSNWSNAVFQLSQEGAPLRIGITPVLQRLLLAVSSTNVNLMFNLSGSTPVQIQWLFTAANGSTAELSSPQHTLNGTSLVLHLSKVTLQDAGTYTVTVITKKNSATATAELAVQAPPVLVNSTFLNRANKGDTVQLVCTFHGYPTPQAMFMKDGAVLSSSQRFNVTPDNSNIVGSGQDLVPPSNEGSSVSITLTISSLEIADAGVYTCLATNHLAVTRQARGSGLLAVYDPAHISNSSLNLTVNETAAVPLHCWGVGFPAPSITWSLVRNGQSLILTNVTSETANSTGGSQLVRTQLMLSSAQPQDQGVYTCHAHNSIPGSNDTIGSATTSFSLIVQTVPRVTPSGALTIVELEGDTASFRFLVERANPPLLPQDVQWTMNGDALNETNPRYSFSADRLRLVVSALTRFDEGQYTVSVRNAAGVNSSSISLDVQFPPKITAPPPVSFVRLAGDSITLSCPSSSDPPALVVWRYSNATITDLVLAQSTVFFLTNITLSDAGLYSCAASNLHGNDTANTTIHVQVPVQLILTPKSRVTAIAGSRLNLTCQARGFPVPSISWYKNNIPLNATHSTMSGLVAISQLVFDSAQLSHNGQYSCQATNTLAGPTMERSSNISLDVLYPPKVKVSSSRISVKELSMAVLSCMGFGVPLPQLTWRRADGQEITGLLNQSVAISQDGQESATLELRLDNATSILNGVFVCSGTNNVTNLLNSPEEDEVILTVLVSPLLLSPSGPSISYLLQRDTSLQQNIKLSFSIAKATPSIHPENVSWLFDLSSSPHLTQPLLPSQRIIFSPDRLSVTIADVMVIDTGSYTMRVNNGVGVAEAVVQLIVTAEPRLLFPLSGVPLSVRENNEVQFMCSTVGLPSPVIIWTKNGQPIDHRASSRVSVTTRELDQDPTGLLGIESTLTISQALLNTDNGVYQCKASNGFGSPATLPTGYSLGVTQIPIPQHCALAGQPCRNGGTCIDTREDFICQCTDRHYGTTCELNVVLGTEPQFTTQPQNTSRPLNSVLTLSCSVTGIPSPRVVWYKDSQPVTDGDSDHSVFTIRELGLKNRGFYHCEAENPSGKITSAIVVVNIDNVIQYKALMVVPSDNMEEFPEVVRETNEFVAGSLLNSNTSLFFIRLTNNELTKSNTSRMVEVVITIVTEEGGSDQLLLQVQQGLGKLQLDRRVTFQVENRFDGCRSAVSILPSPSGDPDLAITLSWPETNIGETAVLKCPCGNVTLGPGNLQATRYCGGSFSGGAEWAVENSAPCNFSDRAREICSLAMLAVDEQVSRLGTITENVSDFDAADVSVTGAVLVNTVDTVGGNKSLTGGFLGVIDNILTTSPSVMLDSQVQANTSSRLLESIENVVGDVPVEDNEPFVLELKNMLIKTQSVMNVKEDQLMFSIDNDDDDSTEKPSISLPSNLFNGVNRSSLRITNTAFLNDNFFQTKRDYTATTTVLSATLQAGGRTMTVRNLTESVRLVLPRGSSATRNATRGIMCVFWDFEANDGLGDWSSNGCRLVRDNATEDSVTCECNHLTNFALLLDVSPRPPNRTDDAVGVALSAVSYIGVIVSILCLIATIITYTASRQLRSSDHGKLLLNLCFALLGLYFSYILSVHGTAVPALCAIFSILLHYFFLVTFFTMGAEAINLYMKLVVVLGSQISNYVLKAVLITWILPGVIVLFCFAPNPSNYIGTHFCRVFGVPFYIGLLVPFLVIYVFNWIMFAVIMLNLVCKDCKNKYKESSSKETKMSVRQQLVITATLSILFGLGWGIGLPATQELHQTPAIRDTFAAFFIILTTFQGLFVFLMHCLRSKEARKLWSQWIFKVTGKEIDLTLSTSAGSSSNYWKKRRQKRAFNSTASQSTSVTYASTSGTLKRQVEKIQREEEEAGYSMAPLDSPTFREELDIKVSFTQYDTEASTPDLDEHPQVVIATERSSDSSSRDDRSKTVDMIQQETERQEKPTATTDEEKVEDNLQSKESGVDFEPAEETQADNATPDDEHREEEIDENNHETTKEKLQETVNNTENHNEENDNEETSITATKNCNAATEGPNGETAAEGPNGETATEGPNGETASVEDQPSQQRTDSTSSHHNGAS